MVSVDNLKVEFGVTPLFEDVSYVINKRDRIALVGMNTPWRFQEHDALLHHSRGQLSEVYVPTWKYFLYLS